MTVIRTSYPAHMLGTYPNIRQVEKAIKTEDLQGLYLDFILADISNLFEEVILEHDASLRPSRVRTTPSTSKWDPRSNRKQAEMAINAIKGDSFSGGNSDVDLTGRIKNAVLAKMGPKCTIPVYEK